MIRIGALAALSLLAAACGAAGADVADSGHVHISNLNLRAALIRDVFQADHPEQAWEQLRTHPAVDSALIHLAVDSSCSPLVRAQAMTFLARMATPAGDAHITQSVAGSLNPSTVESRAALIGLAIRSDAFSMDLLERAVTEGDTRAQHATILALSRVRSPRAEGLLRLASQSTHPGVRDAARRALSRRHAM